MVLKVPEDINKLKLFLFLTDDNAANLARAIGYSPGAIAAYVKGRTPISLRLAKLISQYTQDSISPEELLEDNPKKKLGIKSKKVVNEIE